MARLMRRAAPIAALTLAVAFSVGGTSDGTGSSSSIVAITGSSVAVMQLVVDPVSGPVAASGTLVVVATVRVRANVSWQVTATSPDAGALVVLEPLGGPGSGDVVARGGPTASAVLLVRSDRPDGLSGAAFSIIGVDGA